MTVALRIVARIESEDSLKSQSTPGNLFPKGSRVRHASDLQEFTVVLSAPISSGIIELVLKDDDGVFHERVLTQQESETYELLESQLQRLAFDADPVEFQLAAEALRIKHASLYDPLAAVNSSDVEPLPHQIRAVYEELLPRIPLRYLLADDPGAGKTIMAGLYLKELHLRSDLNRALIVAPGGLVEQWREELSQKFGLNFPVLTRAMVDEVEGRNVFREYPYLIARMDQLSRNEDLMEQLGDAEWDVAIVDEAHRMSAHYYSWDGSVSETKRFKMGRVLSQTAHNFLLMTATPHGGKEEDFQLFMQLLDRDMFEGPFRKGIHKSDLSGRMRRMVKEDLLTMEGKPLFPERRAYTVSFDLSEAEQQLYEEVTEYVRVEMGRAERLMAEGNRKRGNNVGFALTILQRRLASSPEAILRSLERRQLRLSERIRHIDLMAADAKARQETDEFDFFGIRGISVDDYDKFDDEVSDDERAAFEEQVEQVVDLATAAQTVDELNAEIAILEDLITVARRVRQLDEDRKWVELRSLLESKVLKPQTDSPARKIIVFTEHRDTLSYLVEKIGRLFGRDEALVTIHGGTSREARKLAKEDFSENPRTLVLLATDAAGEGLNLQRAHLMVNYDLPWNPNRIEQRFGRIHRIGQREVCHLWNMVATNTREGEVFKTLLDKIQQQSEAYNGNLFHVLGERGAFNNQSLKDLLVEAIRYGNEPEVKARLDSVIDSGIARGTQELLAERALHPEMFPGVDADEVRRQMERARERRLQPGSVHAFFGPAFARLGGTLRRREKGRYEITKVPAVVRDVARKLNRWQPVAEAYERVTFDPLHMRAEGKTDATLIAPGHPLLSSVIELTINELGPQLSRGAIFVDRSESQADAPEMIFTLEQRVRATNSSDLLSHHFDYVTVGPSGPVGTLAKPPFLGMDGPVADLEFEVGSVLSTPWLREVREDDVKGWSFRESLEPRLKEIRDRRAQGVDRTIQQVQARLSAEINHWDRLHVELSIAEREGKAGKIKAEVAFAKARELEDRLASRIEDLASSRDAVGLPALVRSVALIVPSRMLGPQSLENPGLFAKDTKLVERRAVDLALRCERDLGRVPREMPRNHKGYDIESKDSQGRVFFVEVKGRIEGADTFTITSAEVSFAQDQGQRHRLALVRVSSEGAEHDQIRYVTDAFDHLLPSLTTASYNEKLSAYWDRGREPC